VVTATGDDVEHHLAQVDLGDVRHAVLQLGQLLDRVQDDGGILGPGCGLRWARGTGLGLTGAAAATGPRRWT
jgi:hypothetical protein